jgi:type I restriction enzyme S subunit
MSFSEWETFKLGQVCSKIGSGATPKGGKEAYLESGEYSLIRSQNVLDYVFSYDGLAFINEDQASKLNNVTVEEGDVLLNITGDSVARSCQVPKNILPARVNQHVAIIRPNKGILDNAFLKYYLLNPAFKALLLTYSSVGATRNAITKGMIEELNVTIPSIDQQKRIAHILSAIDDKIENNLSANQTLEEIARTLFKQWFVNFNYPNADGNLKDSEFGEIPESWQLGKLADVLEIKYGKDHKHLNPGDIPVYGSGGIMRFADSALYTHESILIPRKGTLSNLFYVNQPFWSVDTMFYTKIKLKNGGKYLFHLLQSLNLASMNVGTAVPSLTTEILNRIPIVIPDIHSLSKYEAIVGNLFNKIEDNLKENETLKHIRNSLLPKLMSGEIEVNG